MIPQRLGMFAVTDHVSPEERLRQIYRSKAVQEGGVVRRKVREVERTVGRMRFEADVRRWAFRAVQNGAQYVVFCN